MVEGSNPSGPTRTKGLQQCCNPFPFLRRMCPESAPETDSGICLRVSGFGRSARLPVDIPLIATITFAHVPSSPDSRSAAAAGPAAGRRSEHRSRFRLHEATPQPQGAGRRGQLRRRAGLSRRQPDRCAARGAGRSGAVGAGRRQRQRRRDDQDHRPRRPARRATAAGGEEHHRGGVRQGRRRQEHDGRQPGAGALGRRRDRRPARCGHLRPQPAADAGHPWASGEHRWPDDGAAGIARPATDVDRFPGRGRPGDGLARSDGDAGAGSAAAPDALARSGLPRDRYAAGHRRHPARPCRSACR